VFRAAAVTSREPAPRCSPSVGSTAQSARVFLGVADGGNRQSDPAPTIDWQSVARRRIIDRNVRQRIGIRVPHGAETGRRSACGSVPVYLVSP
jgi:hypothetical protein